MVKSSGLRGRGGAGFPTGLKWSVPARQTIPGPVYFCVNADESEPGTFVNRVQMELDPHQVLEGIILSCYATRATHGLRLSPLRISACAASGCRRPSTSVTPPATWARTSSAAASRWTCSSIVGAAAYVCGEETGLIESIEGRRAWPRIKPPFPAVEGLFRKPTVVNNVETLACVKQIVDRGVAWFRSMGTPPEPDDPRDPGSFGPKLYGLSGHVNRPGCYEAPLGITAAATGRGVRRRRVEGPPGEGGRAGRPEHRHGDRGRVRHAAGLFRPDAGRLPGPGHGLRRGARRNLSDRRFPAQQLPLLRPRKLRPMHALPRRDALGPANARADQGRPRDG